MIEVNQSVIAESTLFAEAQYHPASSQEEALAKASETLIIGELLKQRAKEIGIEVQDDDVKAAEDDYLEQLIAREVHYPKADDDACRQYFAQNQERFMSSPLLEVRHILLAAAPDDEVQRVEAKTLAEAVIQKLKEGESFSELAAKHSICPSSQTQGSLGQISKGQTVPEFERQVFRVEHGLMEAPVETRYGFHVVMVDRHVPGQPLPYEAVRQKIAEYLDTKVRNKAISQYIQTLISEAEIKGYQFDVDGSPLMQ